MGQLELHAEHSVRSEGCLWPLTMPADYRSDGKRPVASRGLILKTAVTYARLYIKGSHSPPQNQTFITSQQNFHSLYLACSPLPSITLLPPNPHGYSESTLEFNTQASFKSVSSRRDVVTWSFTRLDLALWCSTSVSKWSLLFQLGVFWELTSQWRFHRGLSEAVRSVLLEQVTTCKVRPSS